VEEKRLAEYVRGLMRRPASFSSGCATSAMPGRKAGSTAAKLRFGLRLRSARAAHRRRLQGRGRHLIAAILRHGWDDDAIRPMMGNRGKRGDGTRKVDEDSGRAAPCRSWHL
jgi:hypothetical protein